MAIHILIVEDQRIVREGLRAVLEDEDEIAIVGEAANGQEAIELFTRLQPDVVLMDLQMPLMDGPEATWRIRELAPDARILVLTTYATDEFIFKALRAGARGYLLKDASVDELLADCQKFFYIAGQKFFYIGFSASQSHPQETLYIVPGTIVP